jgi:bacterial leucyl aminopeptidase
MKLLSILPFVSLAIASPLDFFGQTPLASEGSFDLDLNANRLIQLEGHEPFWASERDKARSLAYPSILSTDLVYRSISRRQV